MPTHPDEGPPHIDWYEDDEPLWLGQGTLEVAWGEDETRKAFARLMELIKEEAQQPEAKAPIGFRPPAVKIKKRKPATTEPRRKRKA